MTEESKNQAKEESGKYKKHIENWIRLDKLIQLQFERLNNERRKI